MNTPPDTISSTHVAEIGPLDLRGVQGFSCLVEFFSVLVQNH